MRSIEIHQQLQHIKIVGYCGLEPADLSLISNIEPDNHKGPHTNPNHYISLWQDEQKSKPLIIR